MKKYQQYKSTELDWIGDIPKNWQLVPLKKYLISIVDYRGKTPKKTEDGEIFLVTARNIKGGIINYSLSQEFISKDDYDQVMQRGKPIIGDVLFTTEAPLGEVANVDRDDIALAQRIIKFRANPSFLDNYYLKLWLSSYAFQSDLQRYATGSTALGIKASKLNFLRLLLPPIEEQRIILNYLDSKIKKIDHLISNKHHLIDLLTEERTTIVNQAVTKGIDPDVVLKDSGTEWLGKLPSHWDVGKISYFAKVKTGGTPNKNKPEYWENGSINWMTSGEVNKKIICQIDDKITELGYDNSNASLLPIDSVMIALNGQGKTKGTVAILKVETTCNQSLAAFICDQSKLHYKFLYYFLESKYKDLRGLVGDDLREGLSLGLLKSLYIPIPPLEEQKKISKYIQTNEARNQRTITKIQNEIDLLQEYRTALISEVVTGKIDVREEVVNGY